MLEIIGRIKPVEKLTLTAPSSASISRQNSFKSERLVHIYVRYQVTTAITGGTTYNFATGLPVPNGDTDNGFGNCFIDASGSVSVGNAYVNSSGQLRQAVASNLAVGTIVYVYIDYYTA